MKKIFASLMALTLALSLAACGESTATTSSNVSSETPVMSSPSTTPSQSTSSTITPPVIEESKNLALKGTAFGDGVRDENKDGNPDPNKAEQYMNDGDKDSLWQSSEKGNETEETPSWFGISWEEAQTFDNMFVIWEQAHPLENGFRVEISDDGETWTKVDFTSKRGGTPSETLTGGLQTDKQTDTITLNEAVTTKNVRIVCFTHYTMPDNHPEFPNNAKSPTGVYEFEIYNSADEEDEAVESTESTDETVAE